MTRHSATRRHLPTSPFKAPVPPPVKILDQGDRVLHDKYGMGRIIDVDSGTAAVVDFGSVRVRITAPYASIDKL